MRTGLRLHIILYGHILNWLWRPRKVRKTVREHVKREAILRYLSRYAPEIKDVTGDISPESEPERIFTVWLQGEDKAPGIVKACLRSIRRNCCQELIVLDEHSLQDWIQLPEPILRKWKEGKIGPAHFTDICRTELIYRHGGIWLDATAFVTRPVPEEILNEDFFIFMSGDRLTGSYAFVQNCFFRARKGNCLIKAWNKAIQAYWLREDSIIDYFMHQLMLEMTVSCNPEAARLFDKMPKIIQDPTHALWWDWKDKPFDKKTFDRVTAGAFFQKTEYRSRSASSPIEGSFSDIMQKMP